MLGCTALITVSEVMPDWVYVPGWTRMSFSNVTFFEDGFLAAGFRHCCIVIADDVLFSFSNSIEVSCRHSTEEGQAN